MNRNLTKRMISVWKCVNESNREVRNGNRSVFWALKFLKQINLPQCERANAIATVEGQMKCGILRYMHVVSCNMYFSQSAAPWGTHGASWEFDMQLIAWCNFPVLCMTTALIHSHWSLLGSANWAYSCECEHVINQEQNSRVLSKVFTSNKQQALEVTGAPIRQQTDASSSVHLFTICSNVCLWYMVIGTDSRLINVTNGIIVLPAEKCCKCFFVCCSKSFEVKANADFDGLCCKVVQLKFMSCQCADNGR